MAVIWDRVVGRTELKAKLKVAFADDRMAHALLFAGPVGVGKRQLAQGLAQLLVCETGQGCGECAPCRRIENGQSESLLVVEGEGGSIKLDHVRPIREALALRNWNGRRVVIIDPADQLNPQSANAILKILEEPPPDTYFFLVSAHLTAVLPTIRSRCQLVRVMAPLASELGEVTLPKWVQEITQGQQSWGEAIQQMNQDGWLKGSISWWVDVAKGAGSPKDDSWREIMRDKESALKMLELWTVLLYRARRAASGLPLTSSEDDQLMGLLRTKPLAVDRLWRDLLNLKSDVEAQVDRSLAMDSFWLKAREALR